MTDVFFYLQEFRSWLSGTFYYAPHSPFFFLVTSVGKFLGANEHELFLTTGLLSLTLLSLALTVASFRRETWWYAPLVILIPWSSEILFFRSFAYLKQSLSLSVFLLGGAIVARTLAAPGGSHWRMGFVGYAFILLGMSLHKFTALLGLGTLAIYFSLGLSTKKRNILWLGGLTLGMLLLVVGPTPIVSSNAWQSNGLRNACAYMNCSSFEWMEFLLALFLSSVAVLFCSREAHRGSRLLLSLAGMYFILNLPIWNKEEGYAFRLATASVGLAYLIGCALMGTCTHRRVREGLALTTLFAFAFSPFGLTRKSYDAPRAAYVELERYRSQLKDWIPADSFVLASHGQQFAVTYFLERASAREYPKEAPDSLFSLGESTRFPTACTDLRSFSGKVPEMASCVRLTETLYIERL